MVEFNAAAESRQQFDAATRSLQTEINIHQQHDSSQSFLSKAVDLVWRRDERSLARLQDLSQQALSASMTNDAQEQSRIRGEIQKQIDHDQKAIKQQDNISFFTGTTLKIGSLFLKGTWAGAASGALFALDEMKWGDTWKNNLMDGALGGAKGYLLKSSIDYLMPTKLPFYAKGVGLGVASRALDTGLSRSSYIGENGQFSLGSGLLKTGATALNPAYMATDLVVLGAAYGAGYGLQKVAGPILSKSPFFNTVATSATFGASAGAVSEMIALRSAGESLCINRIGARALQGAAMFGIASIPGAVQAEVQFRNMQQNDGRTDSTASAHQDGGENFKQYKKVGQVRAEKLAQAMEWKTSGGDTMRAEAGDYRITGSDGSTWSVKPDIFQQTYSEVSPGVFEKTAITRASQLTAPTTIQTLEGTGHGNAGDYMVVGPKGERYIVPKAKFESMYRQINNSGS